MSQRRTQSPSTASAARGGVDWPLLFLAAYIGFQIALMFLGSTSLRAPLRIAAFSISLALAVVIWPGRARHPAVKLLPVLLLCLIPGLFMPGQPSIMAAVAQATLYLATLTPLLWVSHRPMGQKAFRRVLLLLWAFNVLSAAVGVLQVYYPGMFQAQLSAVVAERGIDFVGSLTVLLANGRRVLRPMGLTDFPGGAANGGLYAILLGMGLLFTERGWLMRVLAVAGMVVGLFVIYLTHVRVTLVMAGIGLAAIGVAFVRRGDVRRASTLLLVAAIVALAGTAWAFAVGGDETVERFASLAGSERGDAFSESRGFFLQDAFTKQMFDFPFGAGMGRWGMISYYFAGPNAVPLWAEIMWTAWIYDGGIPLMVMFCVVIGVAIYVSWRIGTARGGGNLAVWGAVVLAYNLAAAAATFDTPLFASQTGLELWFLNACLFNAWWSANRAKALAESNPTGSRDREREPLVNPIAPPMAIATAN